MSKWMLKEDIVISGISGRFPESDNVQEYRDNLMNGIDMVTDADRRWPSGLMGLPKRHGQLKDITKFDAGAFGINSKHAEEMDPQMKIFLETTYEAIVDAGINPNELKSKKVGVFLGISSSEIIEGLDKNPEHPNPYCLLGNIQSMIANRVSYHFGFHGPSVIIDTACSSSLTAINEAYLNMKMGICEAAIVGGVNINLKPNIAMGFLHLGVTSADGKCKSFDADANGYARSEAIVSVLLQNKCHARREYATIIHSKINTDGYKEQGNTCITYPSGQHQSALISEVYNEAGVNPNEVSYIECHGTGTPVGDPEEVNSITNFFCANREDPLLIGSVKSNLGHPEGASGLTSLVKMVIAMEEGVIPANLHFKTPNPNIPGLVDGRIKVVEKNTPWCGGIVGINNFGWGGANAHLIIRSNQQTKQPILPSQGLKLFTHAGRTTEGVANVLYAMTSDPHDCNLYTLLSFLAHLPYKTHPYRGYTILNDKTPIQKIQHSPMEKRPLWFVFPGFGCQWSEMARDMMQVQTFRETFVRTDKILQQFNINLCDLINSNNVEIWLTNTTAMSIAITVCQIAFINVFKHLGLEPDGIIGHSVGEMSCAYADGCITEEQCVLLTYWRVKIVKENTDTNCLMYSVGMSFEEAKSRMPEDVYCSCHNAKDNITISGKKESMEKFITELINEGKFTRLVPTHGRAFHTPIMNSAMPLLSEFTNKVLPNPKLRSSRWISTAFPESKWSSKEAKYLSTEYIKANIVNPVYFVEGMQKVPQNALIVEIGPHALLQSIIKRSMGPHATIIGIQNRNQTNGYLHFLTSLGKMYINGVDFDLTKLYEPVQFPVPRGTKMISPLIKWDHSQIYHVTPYNFFLQSGKGHNVEVLVAEEKFSDFYVKDHVIDGHILYPATGYLLLVWKRLAEMKGKMYNKMSVVFEDVTFKRVTIVSLTEPTKLVIGILNAEGSFEVSENGASVATGRIYELENTSGKSEEIYKSKPIQNLSLKMTSKDIHKEFQMKGYQFGPAFQILSEFDTEGNCGKLKWNNNWVTFMDGMLQSISMSTRSRSLTLPTRIRYLEINTALHPTLEPCNSKYMEIPVVIDMIANVTKSGGITMKDWMMAAINRKPIQQANPVVERYSFIPFDEKSIGDLHNTNILKSCLDIIYENSTATKLNIVEVNATKGNLFKKVLMAINSQPFIKVECTVTDANIEGINSEGMNSVKLQNWNFLDEEVPQNLVDADLVFGYNIPCSDSTQLYNAIQNLSNTIKEGGFIFISQPDKNPLYNQIFETIGLQIICTKMSSNNASLFLLRKVKKNLSQFSVIVVNNGEYNKWVEPIKKYLQEISKNEVGDERLWLLAHDNQINGILGLLNCLRHEPGGNTIRVIFNPNLESNNASDFSTNSVEAMKVIYQNIINKDLCFNVSKHGTWGTYSHLPIDDDFESSTVETTTAYINVLNRGDLSSLRWIQSPMKKLIGNNKHVCQIYYAALNFKDVMLASGKILPNAATDQWANKDCLGMEFSGQDENGCKMMGIVLYRGLATSSVYDPILRWKVPDNWTLEDAATVPLVYITVYYALLVRGYLTRNESILIHSGTGGVGQAAINIALSYDCEIYTTVGNKNKKDFLLKRFPRLKPKNIFNSRDTTFENDLLHATNGKGVDIVLNSLAEEKLLASLRCVGQNGRFLEIGKSDLSNNAPIGMGAFLNNISFHGVFADIILQSDHPHKQLLSNLLLCGIEDGTVKPLTRHVFNKNEVEDAFRFMASGKHTGKVLIKIADEPDTISLKTAIPSIKAIRKTFFSSQKSFIITGGLGGVGLELAFWLIDCGAKNVVLTSRSGVKSNYQARCIQLMNKQGANVVVATHDITTTKGTTELITQANELGPVGGIFSLAMVLKDALMENQTIDNFIAVTNPKVLGTSNLDEVSRKLCPHLEWFVAFSSISCGRGNAGQTNYGYANSVMERICEQRCKDGLHGLAIQWGAIGDVGVVAEHFMEGKNIIISGTVPQTIRSCINTLENLLHQSYPVVSSFVLHEKQQSTPDNRLKQNFLDCIGHVLGVKDLTQINPNITLSELGMDSIMGVEIKQIIEKQTDQTVTTSKLRQLDISTLISMNNAKSCSL